MSETTGAPAPAASAAAPSAAPPVASSAPTSTPASATATPSSTPAAASSGEPPQERWADILANTRSKTRSEVEQEYRQKYGWADAYTQDRWGFVQRELDQMASHPQYEQSVLRYAAQMLNARRGKFAAPMEKPKPDLPVYDLNGQPTGRYTYSDQALEQLNAFNRQQFDQQLAQKLGPIESFMGTLQEQAQQAAVYTDARTQLDTLRQNPLFAQHEADIRQALLEHEDWGDNVDRAFNHVLATKVIPSLSQTEQQKVLDTLNTKAAAGTVNPGSSAGTQTPKFRTGNFGKDAADALRYFAEHPDEAAAMARR